MAYWVDKNGKRIRAGDTLRNDFNEPPELPVLEDENGQLFLGDMETPFDCRYGFDEFWEIGFITPQITGERSESAVNLPC